MMTTSISSFYPYHQWCLIILLCSTTLSVLAFNPDSLTIFRRNALNMSPPLMMTRLNAATSTSPSSSTSIISPPYPKAAASVAVRCNVKGEKEAYYLLVQRGKAPNAGMWSLPGGKMELGETSLAAGQRELAEETRFDGQSDKLSWYGTFGTADSIIRHDDEHQSVAFHFMIALCFAQLQDVDSLPEIAPADDAADAQWWTLTELVHGKLPTTPGLYGYCKRAEDLYQAGIFSQVS